MDTGWGGERRAGMLVAVLCTAPGLGHVEADSSGRANVVRACRLAALVTASPSGSLACAGDALAGRRVIAALFGP